MFTSCWSFTYAELKEWLPIRAHLVRSGITTPLCVLSLWQNVSDHASTSVDWYVKSQWSQQWDRSNYKSDFLTDKKNSNHLQRAHKSTKPTEFSYGFREHKNGFKKTSQAAGVKVAVWPDRPRIKSQTVDSKDNSQRWKGRSLICARVWLKSRQS